MKLPAARTGDPLLIKSRELDFSFHVMRRTNRRWGTHSVLYAADPWAVIDGSVSKGLGSQAATAAAKSFARQAREYYTAAERATTIETRPLLYYYSFLNLGKAIAISRGQSGLIGKVMHGVAASSPSGHSVTTAELVIQASAASGTRKSAVDELHRALEGTAVNPGSYPIRDLIAQSVVAHRMWREAFSRTRIERFITIDEIRLFQDASASEVWSRLYIRRDTMRARNRGLTETLRESQLGPTFRPVADPNTATAAIYHTIEQVSPTTYTGRPSDVVMEAVSILKPNLWQIVTTTWPYRNFYIYLSPGGEKRMPQWLSIYSTLFWLGSLTRYQPVELLDVLDGSFGAFFREFLETQPSQLLYILASELKKQDVTRPAIA